MKVDVDCPPHMFVATPFPEFVDTPVKEHWVIAVGESTSRSYEEVIEKEKRSPAHYLLRVPIGELPGAFVRE